MKKGDKIFIPKDAWGYGLQPNTVIEIDHLDEEDDVWVVAPDDLTSSHYRPGQLLCVGQLGKNIHMHNQLPTVKEFLEDKKHVEILSKDEAKEYLPNAYDVDGTFPILRTLGGAVVCKDEGTDYWINIMGTKICISAPQFKDFITAILLAIKENE